MSPKKVLCSANCELDNAQFTLVGQAVVHCSAIRTIVEETLKTRHGEGLEDIGKLLHIH